MVDRSLQKPLSTLFVDLNAYFAAVEQQERPELRGKPVAVGAVHAETGTIIAASYEAKPFGVKTGVRVGEARQMCPGLVVLPARPSVYTYYHRRILAAVETVIPIERVCSIDEFRCRLIGKEREPERAREIALRIKQVIREDAGECLTCSIGVAPNGYLAKVATEMQKPDGLVVLESHDLPHRLNMLKKTDFPGINRRTQARLEANGFFTVEQMTAATAPELRRAFGSIWGERWWHAIRGEEMPDFDGPPKSLGHSYVLAPELRHDAGCREVLLRLTHKACARMRQSALVAQSASVYVRGRRSWHKRLTLPQTNDSVLLTRRVLEAWTERDFSGPLVVGITFERLSPATDTTPSLFDMSDQSAQFNRAVDDLNQRFGKNTVYLAGMARARHTASEKIAFNKTWLFKEGKGDHEWTPAMEPPDPARRGATPWEYESIDGDV